MCIYEHVYGWGWVNVISINCLRRRCGPTDISGKSQIKKVLMNMFTCIYGWGEVQRWYSPDL